MKASVQKRRILWVFPGFGVGGAQVRFAAIANHFGSACTHIIVSLNNDLACRQKLAEHLDVAFPDIRHRPGHMLASIRQAHQHLRAENPNLVVTSNWGAIEWAIAAKLAFLPHLHTEDGFGPEERNHQIPRRVLTRRLALRRSLVVLPSYTLQHIATDIWHLPPDHLRTIPNGIDLQRFANAKKALVPAREGPVIGTIAALRPEKNLSRLIRAFAVVRAEAPANLVIAGEGPERTILEDLARTLGVADDVFFAGHTTEPETWFAAFDVFALSSDTEQMPLSLLEAMAASLPALCTDVGDVKVMVAPENRPFVTGLDDGTYAGALRQLLTQDFRAIGRANLAKARLAYDQGAMFAAHGELLGL
jgi:glycosyltransferase involved in cell wall biosynthesis